MNSTLERIIRRGYSIAGRIFDAVTMSNLKVVAVKSLTIEYSDDEAYRMLASLGSRKGKGCSRLTAEPLSAAGSDLRRSSGSSPPRLTIPTSG